MTINEATTKFEKWMGGLLSNPPGVDEWAIVFKHSQMANSSSAFPFLRATFYRWAQRWNAEAGDLASAPSVLAVGDLHIENYGTWRDVQRRLIWGINDFDEAWELPWTSDLVRLGVSASLAMGDGSGLGFKMEDASGPILSGYTEGLNEGAIKAFDLDAGHEWLRRMVNQADKSGDEDAEKKAQKKAEKFWSDFDDSKPKWDSLNEPPAEAKAALLAVVPSGAKIEGYREQRGPYKENEHEPSGLGSLGRRRYCVVARNENGQEASTDKVRFVREAKALLPSSMALALGRVDAKIEIGPLLTAARQYPDPSMQLVGNWIVRRIAPDADKVSLGKLQKHGFESEDAAMLFKAMGRETANVHLASGKAADILDDLREREEEDGDWFKKAVQTWRAKVEEDWQDFDPAALPS
jgi:uncharacterized protein (DUF2252 family)